MKDKPFNIILIFFTLILSYIYLGECIDSYQSDIVRSTPAITFSPSIKLTNGSWSASYPNLEKGIDGFLYIDWTTTNPTNNFMEVHFLMSQDNGTSFETEKTISNTNKGSSGFSKMTLDKNCDPMITFQTMTDPDLNLYELSFLKINNNGSTKMEQKEIVSKYKYDPSSTIIAANDDFIVISYEIVVNTNNIEYIITSQDGGVTFNDPIKIDLNMRCKTILLDKNNNIFIFYDDPENTQYDLYLIYSIDQGNHFSTPRKIAPDNFVCGALDSCIDQKGTIYLSFQESSRGCTYIMKSSNNGKDFSAPKRVDTSAYRDTATQIAVDNWGGIYVAWTEQHEQDHALYLAYSEDDGNTFYPPTRIDDRPSGMNRKEPSMDVDGVGNVFIVWDDDKDGYSNIFFSKAFAQNRPPRLSVSLPSELKFSEDISSQKPILNLTRFFIDDQDQSQIRFIVLDQLNKSVLKPSTKNGILTFEQLMPNRFGFFEYSLLALDNGEDGIPNNEDDLASKTYKLVLNVTPSNDPPRIDRIGVKDVEGEEIRINITQDNWFNATINFSEVDGEQCFVNIYPSINNLEFNTTTFMLTYHPSNSDVGVHQIIINITDENFTSDELRVIFNIININDSPKPIINDYTLNTNEDEPILGIIVEEWFVDIDGDILSFSGTSSENINITLTEGRLLSIIPKANWSGNETVSIEAMDGMSSSSILLTVIVNPVNDPPTDARISLLMDNYIEGKDQWISGNASDVDDTVLFFEWYEGANRIGFGDRVNLNLKAGKHIIILKAMDGNGNSTLASAQIDIKKPNEYNGFNIYFIVGASISLILIIIIIFSFMVLFFNKKKKKELQNNSIINTSSSPLEEDGLFIENSKSEIQGSNNNSSILDNSITKENGDNEIMSSETIN